ncbi:MAG: hypothetical protein J6N51_13560 [Selenomonas sp.]|nr:hypothetical protein [Selenomonas sp.]
MDAEKIRFLNASLKNESFENIAGILKKMDSAGTLYSLAFEDKLCAKVFPTGSPKNLKEATPDLIRLENNKGYFFMEGERLGIWTVKWLRKKIGNTSAKLDIPCSIVFNSIDSVFAIIGKKKSLDKLLSVRKLLPDGDGFSKWVVRHREVLWKSDIDFCNCLVSFVDILGKRYNADVSPIYLRELYVPHADTKFFENNRKIVCSLFREFHAEAGEASDILSACSIMEVESAVANLRSLDKNISFMGLGWLSTSMGELKKLCVPSNVKKIIIVENKLTGIKFPDVEGAIVIFGIGNAITDSDVIPWLTDMPIYYWGDLDTDGFSILSRARKLYPQIESFCMDMDTLNTYKGKSVRIESGAHNEDYSGLYETEKRVFDSLHIDDCVSVRLEQERIPIEHALSKLNEILTMSD